MNINNLIISHRNSTNISPQLIGGKAFGLHQLQKIYSNIPDWTTLTTIFFEEIIQKNPHLQALIQQKDAKKIRYAIQHIDFPIQHTGILEDLWKTMTKNGQIAVAVRSSAVDEDGSSLSFAGQMDSFLHIISFPQFLQSIRNCWASVFGKRAIAYRTQNNLNPWNAKMAIIVQQMIPAQISGIIFTANPINSQFNEVLITSAYGLGEGIVSGKLNADTYVLNRKGDLLKQEISEKSMYLSIQKEGGHL